MAPMLNGISPLKPLEATLSSIESMYLPWPAMNSSICRCLSTASKIKSKELDYCHYWPKSILGQQLSSPNWSMWTSAEQSSPSWALPFFLLVPIAILLHFTSRITPTKSMRPTLLVQPVSLFRENIASPFPAVVHWERRAAVQHSSRQLMISIVTGMLGSAQHAMLALHWILRALSLFVIGYFRGIYLLNFILFLSSLLCRFPSVSLVGHDRHIGRLSHSLFIFSSHRLTAPLQQFSWDSFKFKREKQRRLTRITMSWCPSFQARRFTLNAVSLRSSEQSEEYRKSIGHSRDWFRHWQSSTSKLQRNMQMLK